MSESMEKSDLQRYLQQGREALLWKLDGLSEYDIRRPLVPTGSNLLGVVKHVATVESGYFGEVFFRPFPVELPWNAEGNPPNADMWALPSESREYIVELYRQVWAHSDATIAALTLNAPGKVSWWTNQDVRLHQILIHMIAETHRHAGQADIIRELIDGAVGHRADNSNMDGGDAAWYVAYRAQLEEAARSFQ
jgi:uncharacterized damage-inducible protein DinB